MLNKLFNDLTRCAAISGHVELLSHIEIEATLANDRDGNRREIIINKGVDMAPDVVANNIAKIYDSFFTKTNASHWDHKINAFEYEHQIDWYLMLSYLYMVNEDRDVNGRAFRTITDACAVLDKLDMEKIEHDPEFESYLNVISKTSKKNADPTREEINLNLT